MTIITHQDRRRPAGREPHGREEEEGLPFHWIRFNSIQFHLFIFFIVFFFHFFIFSFSFILSYLSPLFSFEISFRRYAMKIVFLFFLICRSRCLFFNFFSFSFEKSSRCPPRVRCLEVEWFSHRPGRLPWYGADGKGWNKLTSNKSPVCWAVAELELTDKQKAGTSLRLKPTFPGGIIDINKREAPVR